MTNKFLSYLFNILGHAFMAINTVVPGWSCDAPTEAGNVKAVIEQFCSAEFDGREWEAIEPVRYTAIGRSRYKYKDSYNQPPMWAWHPVVIVSGYQIGYIHVNGVHATADVEHIQVADCTGEGDSRQFIPELPHKVRTRYQLSKIKKKWRIIDPPIPRTSKGVVIDALTKQIVSYEEGISLFLERGDVNIVEQKRKKKTEIEHWISVLSALP